MQTLGWFCCMGHKRHTTIKKGQQKIKKNVKMYCKIPGFKTSKDILDSFA